MLFGFEKARTLYHFLVMGGTYAVVFFTAIIQGMAMQKVYQKLEGNIALNAHDKNMK